MWDYLPTPALYNIFQFLNYKDLSNAGKVCRHWYSISKDEFLWKNLFYTNFKVDSSVNIVSGKSWYEEFKRLCYHIPIVQTETLFDHCNQVLHVSFSHNGKYFATCSKDGYVLVWNSEYPATVKYYKDMKEFSWKYTQYSQFNESDSLLLVSGVHFGTPHSTSGEIAVFNLQADFTLQCRVVNKPYDIFGTWYSEEHLLSGDLHWLAHLVSTSVLWINKASQEVESEHVPITQNMYRFYNRNASSIRAIMVANCLPNSENAGVSMESALNEDRVNGRDKVVEHGNPVSHRDLNLARINNSNNLAGPSVEQDDFHQIVPNVSDLLSFRNPSTSSDYATPIQYNAEYRKVESETYDISSETDDDEDSGIMNVNDEDLGDQNGSKDIEDDISDHSFEVDNSEENDIIVTTDKYLIFTTGFKTYTPHQIGFKRIKPYNFPKRLDPGPSLKERLMIRERRKELLKSNSPPPEPNWLDFDSVSDKFDKIDHLIDLHGHIIGMGLSPDHRYLYVNSRPWPKGYSISNPLDPPPIAQEIDIHVIDLVTLKEVGTMLRSHRAYTPNNECFFIFLDVCEQYVASGTEDKHGYLWDRHYGVCLAKFPHADVVNCVSFNPKNPEMLVTTSDDNTIKIWRSKNFLKTHNLDISNFPVGIDLRIARLKKNCINLR